MIEFIKILILPILVIVMYFFVGCSSISKEEVFYEELRKDLNVSKNPIMNKPAIEIIEVDAENFHIEDSVIPDNEIIKKVKILGAKLDDVIALLTEATGQDIVFQLQSNGQGLNNNNGTKNVSISRNAGGLLANKGNSNSGLELIQDAQVYVSASNISFGRLLRKTVGNKLSIIYNDGTYYLGNLRTITVKIPSIAGLDATIKSSVGVLGAMNVVYDKITSTITFSAREKEYQNIMNYLKVLRNNLYMIEYDIAIYSVDLKDNYSLGINWDLITSAGSGDFNILSKTTSAIGVATSSPSATFGVIANGSNYSIDMIGDLLSEFGKVESIQRPRLLGLAGTDVTLVDGLEEPYIASLTSTAVGDLGIQSSTTAATAISGLSITLNSNIMDGTVLTDINIDITDIIGYTDFVVDGGKFSQPKILKKTIHNSMRVTPGKPIIISGLFRHKTDKGYKGIPGLSDTEAKLIGGSEYKGVSKSEMVIIVTPRIIKYVMK